MTTFQKLIGIFLILIAFLFYWFQIRPAQIKTKCEGKARNLVIDMAEERNSVITKSNFTQRIDEFYKLCLHGNGL